MKGVEEESFTRWGGNKGKLKVMKFQRRTLLHEGEGEETEWEQLAWEQMLKREALKRSCLKGRV